MTHWTPDLSQFRGPRYRAIADALAQDIEAGRLQTGFRLPTHRDLAWTLKVTVGTVSRAYAEAQKRGLIGGEVGRGTYVRARGDQPLPATTDGVIDMAINVPAAGIEAGHLSRTLAELSASPRLPMLCGYQPHIGMPEHRAALATLLREVQIDAPADRVIVTAGAQHALTLALSAVAVPGDTIACENLTFAGLKMAARLLHLRLRGIPMDADGPIPEEFEALCRDGQIKAFYAVPTLHNPTGGIWPLARRQAIVAIARRHGVTIIEDDVYGFMAPDAPPPLAALAPDRVFYVTSTSKSLAPSLRIGVLVAPGEAAARVIAGLRTTIWMAPPLMAEVVRRWVEDGTALEIIAEKRKTGAYRQQVTRGILDDAGVQYRDTHPNSFHLWIPLPEPWRDESFASEARRQGVAVSPAWSFTVGRRVPDAIRLSLGTPKTIDDLDRGVRIVTRLLRGNAEVPLSDL